MNFQLREEDGTMCAFASIEKIGIRVYIPLCLLTLEISLWRYLELIWFALILILGKNQYVFFPVCKSSPFYENGHYREKYFFKRQ